MSQICIPIPSLDEAQAIDVDVTIDGKHQRVRYRVETLEWPGDPSLRIDALRRFIQGHSDEWLLVQIGAPTDQHVPVMFRLKQPAGVEAAEAPSA
jgi:hypothetical protein